MKKFTKLIAVLMIMALATVAFAGCNNESGNNGGETGENKSVVEGKVFVFESCTMDGEDATEMVMSMYKEQSIEFKADGVCVQSVTWSDDFAEDPENNVPVVTTGTYTEDGNTITAAFTVDGEEMVSVFTCADDKLTQDKDGVVMVYTVK